MGGATNRGGGVSADASLDASGGSGGASDRDVLVPDGATIFDVMADRGASAEATLESGGADRDGPSADGPTDVSAVSEAASDGSAEAALGSDVAASDVQDAGALDVVDSGGDAAAVAVKVCAEPCSDAGDCAQGPAATFCHPTSHHCVACIHDVTCVAQASLWIGKTCAVDADCAPLFGDYCVDVEGTGYCAFDVSNEFGCDVNHDLYTIKKFATADMVDVCANMSRTCDPVGGTCRAACTANFCALTPLNGGSICNAATGRCECASNADCGPGAPVCNTSARRCECATSDDCAAPDSGRTLSCE